MIAERVEKIRVRHHLDRRREPESPAPPFQEDQLELFPSLAKGPVGSSKDLTLHRKVNGL
jgi:hypothetical protein